MMKYIKKKLEISSSTKAWMGCTTSTYLSYQPSPTQSFPIQGEPQQSETWTLASSSLRLAVMKERVKPARKEAPIWMSMNRQALMKEISRWKRQERVTEGLKCAPENLRPAQVKKEQVISTTVAQPKGSFLDCWNLERLVKKTIVKVEQNSQNSSSNLNLNAIVVMRSFLCSGLIINLISSQINYQNKNNFQFGARSNNYFRQTFQQFFDFFLFSKKNILILKKQKKQKSQKKKMKHLTFPANKLKDAIFNSKAQKLLSTSFKQKIIKGSSTVLSLGMAHHFLKNNSSDNSFFDLPFLTNFPFPGHTFNQIEDKIIEDARISLKQKMDNFKKTNSDFKDQINDIKMELKGSKYQISFTFDQRNTDLACLLIIAQQTLEEHKKTKKLKLKTMKDFQTFLLNGTSSLQYVFQECDKKNLVTEGTIYITGFFDADRPAMRFMLEKDTDITECDVDIVFKVFKEAKAPSQWSAAKQRSVQTIKESGDQQQIQNPSDIKNVASQAGMFGQQKKNNLKDENISRSELIESLRNLGVQLFLYSEDDAAQPGSNNQTLSWDILAGQDSQKRAIEDTVLLTLTHGHVYDEILQGTRMSLFENSSSDNNSVFQEKSDLQKVTNRPKAILFEGPPGTGKTTSAKIIASQVKIPLIYLPVEAVMSKYVGESEKHLSQIFEVASQLGKSIIFIDEIDSLAMSRSKGELHEHSRRLLSTLLRKLDSFESQNETLVICATNRKEDLDPAIVSRMDLSIEFGLPDEKSRAQIFKRYSKQLTQADLDNLGLQSKGMSGRNIYEICKDCERRWASKRIRGEVTDKLPGLQEYVNALEYRINQNLSA